MSTDDLSLLSDTDFLALTGEIAQEAVRRGSRFLPSYWIALHRDEIEREGARQAREQAHREQTVAIDSARREQELVREAEKSALEERRTRVGWRLRKKYATAIEALLGKGGTFAVWEKVGDKRVYIDYSDDVRIVYYVTGNIDCPPKSLRTSWRKKNTEKETLLLALCELMATEWLGMPKTSCREALNSCVNLAKSDKDWLKPYLDYAAQITQSEH